MKYPSQQPLGGDINRQINFLLNNYKYSEKGEDPDNQGLLIPRYIASGRVAPNGQVYRKITKQDETDLVPVRSIVTKTKGDLNIVTPDLLGERMKKASFPEGSAIGLSFGSSFSESTTQGILALKHGGHERVLYEQGELHADGDCVLTEDGNFLILQNGRKKNKYPRPSNWVGVGKNNFQDGELIGTAYQTTSPTYKLHAIIKLVKARGESGKKYFEKDNVTECDCYAYDDGVIHYTEIDSKRGPSIKVTIGDREYNYSPESMYYYPDGTKLKKYQRFCSGVVNMSQVMYDLKNDINSVFIIFRDQYYMLSSGTFQKTFRSPEGQHISQDDVQEEIIEMIFAGLTHKRSDPETGEVTDVVYRGVQNSVLDRKSFFTTLSYGWPAKTISAALRGETNISNDIMTETVLGLLLNDTLDNGTNKN